MARGHFQRLLTVAAAVVVAAGGVALAAPAGVALAAPPQQTLAGSSIFRIDHSPQPAGSSLRASTAIAADDVWAVGSQGDARSPLAEHWNGSAWTVVPTPAGSGFTAVSAVSSTDVWAIGTDGYHWNGKAWSVVHIPDPAPPTTFLSSPA